MCRIAGGDGASGPALATAELYDPGTGKFSPTGSMVLGRAGTAATLLHDGRVLIAGGSVDNLNLQVATLAELYDPKTGEFSPTGSMAHMRFGLSATLLMDGRVLVLGGSNIVSGPTATAELYDPATGTFSSAGSMATTRAGYTATLLPDGQVLIAGGDSVEANFEALGPTLLASAELYLP